MAIIPALPFILTNGITADATQVMANFNDIVDNVNSNAVPASGGFITLATITASTIDSTPTGSSIPSTGAFTTLSASMDTALASTLEVGGLATLSGGLTLGNLLTYATPVSVASASTVDLGAQTSNVIDITGTTAITSFGATAAIGQEFDVRFIGSLVLTNDNMNLILPTGANIQTQANDYAKVRALGSGAFIVLEYYPSSGAPVGGSASIQGSFKNLRGAWVSNTTASWSADQIIVQNTAAFPNLLASYSQTLNSAISGAGGLDTGSLTSSTWYAVYAIYNPSTAAASVLMSLSFSAPTLPSGYTYSGLIGAVRTDGSSNFIGFVQYGGDWQYVVGQNLAALPTLASGSYGSVGTPTFVAQTVRSGGTGTVAPNASKIKVITSVRGGGAEMIVSPNNSYPAGGGTNYNFIDNGDGGNPNQNAEILLESNSIYSASNSGNNALYGAGFTMNL